jgi:hypothetical protein
MIRQWHCEGKGVEPYKISGRLLYDIEDVKKFEEMSRQKRQKKNKSDH